MLIGFCGQLGSGKTLAAMHLVGVYGYTRLRFAGPLKDMMRALGLSQDEIDGDKKELPCELLGGRTPRYAMQTIGTEWGRHLIHPQIWVKAWTKQAELLIEHGHSVVCDDVRFPNELDAIHHLGGKVYKVVRPTAAGSGVEGHASEQMAFEPDGYLNNQGTVMQLTMNVDALLG